MYMYMYNVCGYMYIHCTWIHVLYIDVHVQMYMQTLDHLLGPLAFISNNILLFTFSIVNIFHIYPNGIWTNEILSTTKARVQSLAHRGLSAIW